MVTRSVDEVAAELYALEPSAFVAARADAVHAARDAGDREIAAAIGKLRRPTQAAWAVNLLARADIDGLDELLSLGAQLREAQQQLQREALQLLSHRRHEVIAALTHRAQELTSEAGHPLGAGAIQQVRETLGAAIAEPEAAREVQLGRLVTPLSYAGFGPELAGFGPDVAQRPEGEPRHGRDVLAREFAETRRELASLQQEAQQAAQELQRCEDAVAGAQRALRAATEQRDAAARRAQAAERASHDAQSRAQRLAGALDEPSSG